MVSRHPFLFELDKVEVEEEITAVDETSERLELVKVSVELLIEGADSTIVSVARSV